MLLFLNRFKFRNKESFLCLLTYFNNIDLTKDYTSRKLDYMSVYL